MALKTHRELDRSINLKTIGKCLLHLKNIKVKISFKGFNDEFGTLVKTDLKRFQQVLLNLYSNAIKFT